MIDFLTGIAAFLILALAAHGFTSIICDYYDW